MSFKLAVFSDEVSQDLSKAIAVAKDFELDGLEIRSVWDKGAADLTTDDARRIRSELDANGLQVCALSTPFLKCDLGDENALKEQLEILKRCLVNAEILGTNILRVFTFWRKPNPETYWDAIAELYREQVLPIVTSKDTILAIENEASTIIGTGNELRQFLAKLEHPQVKGVWDPCNVHFLGSEYKSFPEDYESCKGDIVHVHLKDAVWNHEKDAAECVVLGDGEVRIADQLEALNRDGYHDWLSLETHWRPTQLSEAEINLPGGSSFSKEGEFASRKCLGQLREMLQQRNLA